MNKRNILLAKGVKLEKSIFDETGGMLSFELPEGYDLIVLAGNKGQGYIPYKVLLPHQVYLTDLKETFEKNFFEVIYVLPVKSELPFQIAYNGKSGKQAWVKK
jgi:hypothetical protein